MSSLPVYACLHHPRVFSSRSGMFPLVEALQAQPLFYPITWENVSDRSWRLGRVLQAAGQRYSGSEWNALLPWLGEKKLARQLPDERCLVHFLWGEFSTPRQVQWFRKKGNPLVACFHATAWRQPQVLSQFKGFDVYDRIVLMSESQRPFFLEHGVAEERLQVILHGVDTRYWVPDAERPEPSGPLKGLIVGGTERDHAFMAAVMQALPAGTMTLDVVIPKPQQIHYRDAPGITLQPRMDDEALRHLYQQADILVMPMIDCTANNAVLEAMCCGTPVLSNRIGGIPEYVGSQGGFVLDDKNLERWVAQLTAFSQQPEALAAKRAGVRSWAESFDWHAVAQQYQALYETLA